MKVIELKKGRHTFEEIWGGEKNFTYHSKIPNLIEGCRINFHEYNPVSDFFSGRTVHCAVTEVEDHGEWMLIRFDVLDRREQGCQRARSNYNELVFEL